MQKRRLFIPVAIIAVVVLMLMAPAGALAASDQHRGGHQGWHNDGYQWNSGDGGRCSNGFYYTVRWGDTIGDLAWRFGVNSTYLSRVNGLWNPNRIYAGQTLWIPGGGCW
jgi:hypothetical protein